MDNRNTRSPDYLAALFLATSIMLSSFAQADAPSPSANKDYSPYAGRNYPCPF